MQEAQHDAKPGLRDRAMSERRNRIRAAAERLFAEHGYENTTTKQIAEEAEVGEATLFRYVSNKRELLLLMLGDGLDDTLRMIRDEDARRTPSCTSPQDFIDRIYAIHRARAEFYLTDPENVLRYLQFGLTAGSKLGLESIRQGDEVIAITKAVLDTAEAAGLLLPRISTQAVATNCNGIYIHEVLRTPVRDYEPETLWARMHARLSAQIEPLFPGVRA